MWRQSLQCVYVYIRFLFCNDCILRGEGASSALWLIYGLEGAGLESRAKIRDLSILQNAQTVSEAHSATRLMCNSLETSKTNVPETWRHNAEERIPHVHRCRSPNNWSNFDSFLRISSRLNARKGQGNFLHKSHTFCPLDPTRLTFNWVNTLLAVEVKEPRRETEHQTNLLPSLRMRGAIPPLSHMPS